MNKDKVEKLKPCPFCGGQAEMLEDDSEGYPRGYYYVRCDKCGARSGFYSQKNAADKWNKRYSDEDR